MEGKKFKLTDTQFKNLLRCHTGVGVIAIKTGDTTVSYAEIWLSSQGQFKLLNDTRGPEPVDTWLNRIGQEIIEEPTSLTQA